MKTHLNPPGIPAPAAPYSHQVMVAGAVRWLVVSGQLGQNGDGSVPDAPLDQLALALTNVSVNLEAAGMSVADLIKVTIFVTVPTESAERRRRLEAWLGPHRPAMTLVQVAGLAAPQFSVEVEAWACQDEPIS